MSSSTESKKENASNEPHTLSNREILKDILRLGLPMNISQLSGLSITTVTLMFAAKYGATALGGASLALGMMNATGYSFASGLCGALETLLSHSYGRNPTSKVYGLHAQRMCLLLLIVSIPLAFLLANIDVLLVSLGQSPLVVAYTARYCRITMFALPAMMMLELLRRYYAAQHLSTSLVMCIVGAALINPLLQWLCTSETLGLGYDGAPLAWSVLTCLMVLGLFLYLVGSGAYKSTWGGWSSDVFTHWGPMLKLAMPSLGMTFSEWAAMEINGLCSGFAPETDLAAFAIIVQAAIFMWNLPSGVYMASAVLIGNRIGEGSPLLARRYCMISILVVFAMALLNVFLLIMLGPWFVSLFTDDPVVTQVALSMRWYVVLFHPGDSFQSNMMGILRGMGMQRRGAIGITLSFGIVGVPFGIFLFLAVGMDVSSLWIGPAVGVYLVGLPIYVWTLLTVDWTKLEAHHGDDVPADIDDEETEIDQAEMKAIETRK